MIILLGATGMMGKRIAHQLIQNYYDSWQPSRQWLVDFYKEKNGGILHQELQQKITKKTILINAIGSAPGLDGPTHRTAYLTQKSIIDFCIQQKIAKIISLSALSSYPVPTEIPYLNYKYQLDNELLNSTVTSYIVRPSLIYAVDGASTQFFKHLTKIPILALPKNPNYLVSPIDADELTQFILALIAKNLPSQIFEMGTEAITIQNYLKRFNPKLIILPLPEWVMQLLMNFFELFIPAIVGKYAYKLLKAGSTNGQDDFLKVMDYPATFPQINTIRQTKESHDV